MAVVWSFRNVIVTKVDGKLFRFDGLNIPLSMVDMRVVPAIVGNRDGTVVIEVTYSFEIESNQGRRPVKISWTNALFFTVVDRAEDGSEAPHVPDLEEVEARMPDVLQCGHDHLRVHLHWLTSWMGLPPLVLEPYRSAEPAVAT